MAASLHKYTVVEAQNAGLGQAGCVLIPTSDTDARTGPFVAITALTDAVIDLSECDMSFCTGMETDGGTVTIPKGVTIYGRYESIELDSGSVIAYRG
tara:strand:+ start:93 stop:383 length:291 start_codon:yes stop_codon:yes gene_type:complete